MSSKRISDIKPGESSKPLEVRVIKKWKTRTKKPDLCYLFVDIHGNAIEAISDLKEESYFDSIIKIQSCYIVANYFSVPSRTYMAIVPYTTSIRIGKRASFDPLCHNKIPTIYYNFASYDVLKYRRRNHTILTDYIGRVEKVRTISTKSNKLLTRISLQDERKHMIEVTLWKAPSFEVALETSVGQVLAIASTMVTDFQGSLQLESTSATCIAINPPISDLDDYVKKFKDLENPLQQSVKKITIAELLNINPINNTQSSFECLASVKDIFNYRIWHYALCSQCSKKLYPEKDALACEDHGTSIQPKYCVNAKIADETSSTNVVFFNEAMTNALNVPCSDMVIKHGHTNPKVVPPIILSIKGIPKIIYINLKADGTIDVNQVFNASDSRHLKIDHEKIGLQTSTHSTKPGKRKQHQSEASCSGPTSESSVKKRSKY